MKWCCAAFEGHLENAGKRGIAVFPETIRLPQFVLQFRAVDGTFEYAGSQIVSSVVDVVIRFCPWCGADLVRHYSDVIFQLSRNDLRIPI